MRKITQQAAEAFWNYEPFNSGNTRVKALYTSPGVNIVGAIMELHGNAIARVQDGKLYMTLAGWATATTRERLNGVYQSAPRRDEWGIGARARTFHQIAGSQFFDKPGCAAGLRTEIENDELIVIWLSNGVWVSE